MIITVIGTPDSGKSKLAEDLALKTGSRRRYYIATMKVYDEAGVRRIEKHREARDGKGFITIEMPYAVDSAADLMDEPETATVLLECMSNLAGNELYENLKHAKALDGDEDAVNNTVDDIIRETIRLSERVGTLIVVTNQYPAEDTNDEKTLIYIDILDKVNERLIKMTDELYDLRDR